MAERGAAHVVVDAAPAAVMDVLADFPAYPRWAGPVRSTEVLERGEDRPLSVRFVVDAGVLADTYVLDYVWDGDAAVRWSLREGRVQRDQQGEYRLRPVHGGTHVDYELCVDLAVPVPGFLVRRAQRYIMSTAVESLKQEVESR